MSKSKTCNACQIKKTLSKFHKDSTKKDGRKTVCAECAAKAKRARHQSDHANLTREDFQVAIGNATKDPKANQEKRQDFAEEMGQVANGLRSNTLTQQDGAYVAALAEQERRFGNRRLARSVSLAMAGDALRLRQFKESAAIYLRNKISASGYALKERKMTYKRSVILFLSDLHLGSDLGAEENPVPFGAIQEARRLEHVLQETCAYKPHYRDQSECVLLLGGDMIEGALGHDLRDGAPLVEQKVIFWRYFRSALALLSSQFPSVRVFCQPGNHGRDKVRHPGRATSSKWDGHEWELYYGLREMCSGLPNVSFDLPFRAVSFIDLHGSRLLLTHGDTEIKIGDPDTKSLDNSRILNQLNASEFYGHRFDAACFGHYHKPRFKPGLLFNGALVPPNGYARSAGYVGEPCGQWLWESVEGFPIGDVRFISVGSAQDKDERLGKIIQPFRFDL